MARHIPIYNMPVDAFAGMSAKKAPFFSNGLYRQYIFDGQDLIY